MPLRYESLVSAPLLPPSFPPLAPQTVKVWDTRNNKCMATLSGACQKGHVHPTYMGCAVVFPVSAPIPSVSFGVLDLNNQTKPNK